MPAYPYNTTGNNWFNRVAASQNRLRPNARIDTNPSMMSNTMNIGRPIGADLTMTKNFDTA